MSKLHLAQLNIARMRGADINAPIMATFVAQLDEVNGIAEASEGFVWRLKDETGNATDIKAFDDPQLIVNMSVWKDLESLEKFVFNDRHLEVMRARREWFDRMNSAHMVLWWIPEGHQPTLDEAKARLNFLNENGATAAAFTFRQKFSPPQ